MSTEKTQSQIFADEIIPSLFHNSPGQFLQFLHRDGNKFLSFYWKLAGEQCTPELKRDSFGLNYYFREPASRILITMILLPEPIFDGETYFSALIYRPDRRILFVADTTKIFNLEKYSSPDNPSGTRMVEWTRRKVREIIRGGPAPYQEEFYRAVIEQIREN
ncbi:MAG: hypothetical protein AB1457_02455 [Chloroflexota bacterium]|nr:MAG: hypothetical protein KatS3mg047_0828 [Bellilinea sp.]